LDFLTVFNLIAAGSTILGGINDKNAADNAAAAAQQASNFNANIIERDIDLLEKQRQFVNANFGVSNDRKKQSFKAVQGEVKANYAYGGIDISEGTPISVLRKNAREMKFELDTDKFNNDVTNMQIDDAQENAKLNAQLARMEGGSAAASLRAQGTASLIKSFGSAARTLAS
tara:strand:+ start:432 stop:947 length:516 start_codon:yes stop_codon:yes gene_type:complete